MAESKLDFNDDDLNSLLEQLEGLENLDIDFDDAKALGEMANSVTDDELDELLTNHETGDGDMPDDDFGFFSKPFEDGDEDSEMPQEAEAVSEEASEIEDTIIKDTLDDGAAMSEMSDMSEMPDIPDMPDADTGVEAFDLDVPDLGIPDTPDELGGFSVNEDNLGLESAEDAEDTQEQDAFDYFREFSDTAEAADAPESLDSSGFPELSDLYEPTEYYESSETTEPSEPIAPQTAPGDDFFGVDFDDEDGMADDMLMPDFGFNESFTTGGKGEDMISSRRAQRERKKEDDFFEIDGEEEEPEEEKKKGPGALKKLLSAFKAAPVKLYGVLPAPVRKVASSKVAPAVSKVSSAVRRKRSQRFKMIATAVIMFVALAVSSFFLYQQYKTMRTLIEENKVIVKKPANRFNYANYIFTENKKTLNGIELTLRRLVIDEYMCSFHFDKLLQMDRYFAELRDDKNKYYGLYTPLLKPLLDASPEEDSMSLWFEGVDKEAESLFLTIWDSETKESVVFEVDMKDYEMLPVKYIEASRGARTPGYDVNVVIEGGTFSSSMSTVVYKLEGKDDARIAQVTGSMGAPLIMENSSRSVAPLLKKPLLYEIDDTIAIGRMDFGPVRSLENKARLTISGLFNYFDIDQTVSAAPLFDTENEEGLRFDLGEGALVLEGMRKRDGIYVLVFHFENQYGERVSGTLDLNLLIRTYTGVEVKLSPVIRSKTEGGDILFEYETPNSVVDNAGPDETFIEIRSVMLDIQSAEADISVPQSPESADSANYADISKFVKKAYTDRLAIKSGTGDKNTLGNYFSPEVLDNEGLNILYEPETVTQPPEYSVMVSTVARLSRFEYFAVVDESWLGISGSDRTHVYNSHKIIIEQNGNNFVIVSDELIVDD